MAIAGLALLVLGALWALKLALGRLMDLVPSDVDVALGEQSWATAAPPERRCTDPRPLAYINALAAPLLAAEPDHTFEYQFTVVDDPQVNAFALPGGFITVNMGLIEAAESGEEIAAVLAHELQHVILRHGTRRMLRELGGLAIVFAVFGGTDFQTAAYLGAGLLDAAYDRGQEQDADDHGRALMKRAGLDPTAMATFFERLAAESEPLPGVLTLLSTHPDPGERASRARDAAKNFAPTRSLPAPPPDLTCTLGSP